MSQRVMGRGPFPGRSTLRAAAVIATAALLVGCAGAAGTPPPRAPVAAASASPRLASPVATQSPTASTASGVAWRSIGALDLGLLEVPLDYADPAGSHVKLMVGRVKATDAAKRLGMLVFLEGGPGGSGMDWLQDEGYRALPQAVRERFDIVSFDARGLGVSQPLFDCPIPANQAIPYQPLDGRTVTGSAADVRTWASGCATGNPEIIGHLGSEDVVHDIDRVREALGEERISLLGMSYGTFAGQLYAERYPEHVRAVVLDAPVDPSPGGAESFGEHAAALETQLRAFLAWCDAEASCTFHGSGGSRAALAALMARFVTAPIGGVTAVQAWSAVEAGLYGGDWKWLAAALEAAAGGDAADLGESASAFVPSPQTSGFSLGVLCLDWTWPRDISTVAAMVDEVAQQSPDFSGQLSVALVCSMWPVPPTRPSGPIDAAGSGTALILASTGDPATPYAWAKSVASQLASSVLVTREGPGHVSIGRGNGCIDTALERYLVDPVQPPEPVTCR